ncbi:amidohydrolase family protein [Flavobacterium sp. 245]|uniref:amidohydrolase family protein n=1 Tax=Flavobacterium sp. 245 TaxID=2512115 RepID=UPI00105E8958|nr:amidohydrolase family protein [Flavobacterium sp. 245]TDO93996.1 imidazolonepropionase-like amidohydrolase [Flavobacterium sp. 245]
MTKKYFFALWFLISSLSVFSQTYITNTTVVDVENHKLIPEQTVVLTNDKISSIQSSKKIKIPTNSNIIDGSGKYLAPGLTDAHIHFFQNGGLYTRPDVIDLRKFAPYDKEIAFAKSNMEDKLRRYLQNGITTVIDVGANYHYLQQRNDFKDKNYAPTIFITGPLATTYEPAVYQNLKDDEPFVLTKTVEEGIKSVQNQLQYKPDFIKIWYIAGADGLPVEESARKNLPIVKAVIDEAHKYNLKVAVHATERITAQLSVENGADLLVHSVEDEVIKPDFIALLKKKKTILCPTLVVHRNYSNSLGQQIKFSLYELEKSDAFQLGSLQDLKHIADTALVNKYKKARLSQKRIDNLKSDESNMLTNLKLLSDAGVIIATGTDAGNIGTLHATSYQPELKMMQESGIGNWQILTASTLNGAKFIGKEKEFGSIAVGKKANLILLDQNPVENLENLTKINKVINQGTVFNPNEILKDTPEILVQRQLNGYNFRNIDAFLEPYAEDVELYDYPNTLIAKGKEKIRGNYQKMFENTPNLHCEIKGRIVQGNIVIDQEHVLFGDKYLDATAIYHIENGKIKKVYFIQ